MKKKALFALLALAFATGCSTQRPILEDGMSFEDIALAENGIKIKKAGTGTDSQGREYATFSYTLTPNNTTHDNIGIACDWNKSQPGYTPDWGDASDYIALSINTSSRNFTVTKKADFSHVIDVTLYEADNYDVNKNATIELHLNRKWYGWASGTRVGESNTGTATVRTNHKWAPAPPSYQGGFYADNISSAEILSSSINNGFSSTYTDDPYFSQSLTVSNFDVAEVSFRYKDGGSWLSFDAGLQTAMLNCTDGGGNGMGYYFPSYLVGGASNADAFNVQTNILGFFSSYVKNNLNSSQLQTWDSYDEGMIIDVKLTFDLSFASVSKTGCYAWYSVQLEYSDYSYITDVPLQNIMVETPNYSF